MVKELALTRVLKEAETEIISVEKPNSYIHSMAKPKPLSLDSTELQSITKLQNWCPSTRISAKRSKSETKIPKTFASQYESLVCPKPELQSMKLTQYKSVLWNPPLRRNMLPAVSSGTPSKRAKIFLIDKPDRNVGDESKAEADSAMEGKDNDSDSKQTQEQAAFENAPTAVQKAASLADSIRGENPAKVGFNGDSFDAKQSFAENLQTGEIVISYTPTKVDKDQQVCTDPPEGCPMESSQISEVDMFFSQEPTEVPTSGMQPEFPSEVPTKVSLTKTEEQNAIAGFRDADSRSQEHFNIEVSVTANTVDCISLKNVDQSRESSDEDMFEAENLNEDTLNNSRISKEDGLKTASHQSEESVKDNKENVDEEDMFYYGKEIALSINLEKAHGQLPKPSPMSSPSVNGVADNSGSDIMQTPPGQGIEDDFYMCKTVKRVCKKVTQASPGTPKVPEITEVPDVPELSANDTDVVVIANNSTRDKGTQSAVSVHPPTESSLPDASAIRAIDLNLSCETLVPTKSFSQEIISNAGYEDDADLNIGNEAKSQNLAPVSGDINSKNNSEKSAIKAVKPTEGDNEKVEAEGIRLVPCTSFVVDGSKIDGKIADIISPKEAEMPRAAENNETEVKDSDKIVDFPGKETANVQTEMKDPDLDNSSANTEIKPNENEKKLSMDDVEVLSSTGNLKSQRTSVEPGVENMCKDIFSQAVEQEPHTQKAFDKTSLEVDSTRRSIKKPERCEMKPYAYEMDQDFDISQSQLIEIESAIMRESRAAGPGSSAGGMPRVASAAPSFVPGTCGEARMPGFSLPAVPPAPALDWKKKMQEDRQKLRAAVHQLSRLNAMLMSVRREVWPTTGASPDAPLSSNMNRQGPSGRRY